MIDRMQSWRVALWAGTLAMTLTSIATAADHASLRDVFVAGQDGYHTYRIPALLVSQQGTLLAFCEGRKTGRGDAGDIDLLVRRSTDSGNTWSPITLVYEQGGAEKITIGNPCPVVDRQTGTIWLPFCRDNNHVLVTSSSDDGRTWSAPRDITPDVKPDHWGWYATGPGVGIQLARGQHAGRLVIPCDHREKVAGHDVMFSHVFYSDDHGQTWQLGGTVDRHTDECQVVELADGDLSINMRNYWGRADAGNRPERGGMRATSRSSDGGETWSPLEFDVALIEPICQASLIAVDHPQRSDARVLLFSNPATKKTRSNMTVRASFDEGRTWPASQQIDPGTAAYSSLAQLPDGRIGILYERDNYGQIVFTTVPLELSGDTK
ncbi:MAG: sialidase family protein [Pirellulales bacterium]